MALLSVNELTTYRWSFEQDVARYKAAGIPAMGVWRQKLADFGEEKGAELLADEGLKASSLLWAGGFTGSDGRSHRDSIDDASEALRSAATLGAETLVVYSGARGGHTHNHARRLVTGALKELAPLAEEQNITLAIEPMHEGCADEWTFLTNAEDVLALLETIDSPRVKLVLDTYHLGQSDGFVEQIGELVPHVAIVHLGDAKQPPKQEQNRCRLGEGTVPLGPIIAALTEAGYTGYYDIELLGEEIEASDYDELLAHARETFEQLTAS
jgi:sugar phosphate isomerase/epimerase